MTLNIPMRVYFRLKITGAKEFLKRFIEIASSYMFSLDPSLDSISEVDVAVGYWEGSLRKILAINTGGGESSKRICDLLSYISINPLAFYSADTVRIIARTIQAWDPKYLSPIHHSIKKVLPIVRSDALQCQIEVTEDFDTVALVISALTSGIHRNGMSLRQVAMQWIIARLAFHKDPKPVFQKLIRGILEDTLIWFPMILNIKGGAYGSEFIHSIAADPLRDLAEISVGIRLDPFCKILMISQEILKVCKESNTVSQAVDKASECIKDWMKMFIRKDTDPLLGRLTSFKRALEAFVKSNAQKASQKYDSISLLLTEQSGPAQILYIIDHIYEVLEDRIKIHLFYTPQTYWNRFLIDDYSDQMKEYLREKYGIGIEEICKVPIPSASPLLAREILEHKIPSNSIVISQGSLIPSILAVLASYKKGNKRVIFV